MGLGGVGVGVEEGGREGFTKPRSPNNQEKNGEF